MSGGPDLTRWNRAGLARFRYVDGNALTFLEDLRAELRTRFPDWTTLEERQYDEPSGDWGWEIVRAFARVSHVLAEHADAYANEGYLRTATQWDSVRKLVSMLDVQPAPPASASTPLVIEAKGEAGPLAPGFAVRHTPAGGPPVVFETLDELTLDPALNGLHLAAWNLSPAPLVTLPPPRPLSAIARRSARVVQGVGRRYQALLDARAPLGAGVFTVADFRNYHPSELRLWEAKSKAEILLDFPWTSGELAALAPDRLSEVLRRPASELAQRTGATTTRMEQFLEDLREVEMALDEDVFRTSRLADVLGPGARPEGPPPLWAAPEDSGISAGQTAIVVSDAGAAQQGAVVRVRRLDEATREISLEPVAFQPPYERWTRGVSTLLAKPKVIAPAHVTGSPRAVAFVAAHGLAAGDTVAWASGGTWTFATVEKADDRGVLLSGNARPAAGTEIYRGVEVNGLSLPLGHRAAATPVGGGLQVLAASERREEKDTNQVTRYYTVTRPGAATVVFVPGGAAAAGRVASVAPAGGDGRFGFTGKAGELKSGQWVVGDDRGRLLALRIDRIEEFEDHFTVTFASVVEPAPRVASLPVASLMGVGPVVGSHLLRAKLDTIGKLAATAPNIEVPGLTRTARLEVRAKALLVVGFPFAPRDLEAISDQPLSHVMGGSPESLAALLGKPLEWALDLVEKVRLVQAVVDEPPVTGLRVGDLLPLGAPRPVRDYELTRLDRLYGVFEHVIRPAGWNVNDTPVSGARLPLELPPASLLARGRRLIIERDGLAREARVVAVDPIAKTVDVAPPLEPEAGFTRHNLLIRANVVRSGHGETKPAKVLGSGDAAQRSQTFVLAEKDVAFVADPTQPAGVAAAVQVTVGGRVWQPVAALRDSRPADPHYEVRLTEDGFLALTFGDGLHGRRLPTGTNNVRVAFRTGTGLAGNVPPGRLTKPARTSPRVAAVSQPLDATGGNDREDVASLKTQAPRSVLTLERAVSLTDFGALAARQASVWQARAFALPTGGGRHATVEVVVVPAGGGPLGPLAAELSAFLATHALPGSDIRISAYRPKPFDLEVEIEVKSAAFDRDEVRKRVETALLDAFALRRRRLGAPLFASEVYEVVEGMDGVESSLVKLGDGRRLGERVLRAADREVVFLDAASSRFSVTVREFEL